MTPEIYLRSMVAVGLLAQIPKAFFPQRLFVAASLLAATSHLAQACIRIIGSNNARLGHWQNLQMLDNGVTVFDGHDTDRTYRCLIMASQYSTVMTLAAEAPSPTATTAIRSHTTIPSSMGYFLCTTATLAPGKYFHPALVAYFLTL